MLKEYIKAIKKDFKLAIGIGIIFLIISIILLICKISSIGLILFSFGTIMIVTEIVEILNFNNIYKIMSESEKNDIENELNKTILTSKNNYTITENGIFIPRKLFFMKYQDIILIYERPKFRSNTLEVYINIITEDNKRFHLPTYTTNMTIGFEYYDLKEIIIKKNPSVLVGKNKENKIILKEKYNIIL